MALIRKTKDGKYLYGILFDSQHDKLMNTLVGSFRMYKASKEHLEKYWNRGKYAEQLRQKQKEHEKKSAEHQQKEKPTDEEVENFNQSREELHSLSEEYAKTEFPGQLIQQIKVNVPAEYGGKHFKTNDYNPLKTIYGYIKENDEIYGEWEDS